MYPMATASSSSQSSYPSIFFALPQQQSFAMPDKSRPTVIDLCVSQYPLNSIDNMKKIRDQTRNKLESQFELLSVHQQWGVWTRPDGAPVTRAEGLLGGILEGLARCLITRRSYGSTCHIVLRVFADSSDPPSVQPWTNKREKMLPLRWDTVGERVRKMVKAMTFVTDDCQFDGLAMSGLQGTVAAPFIGPPNKPYYTWRYPAMKNQKPPVQARHGTSYPLQLPQRVSLGASATTATARFAMPTAAVHSRKRRAAVATEVIDVRSAGLSKRAKTQAATEQRSVANRDGQAFRVADEITNHHHHHLQLPQQGCTARLPHSISPTTVPVPVATRVIQSTSRLRRPRSVMPSRYGATLPTTNTIPLSGYNGLPAATTDLHHIPDSEVNKYQSSYSELSSALELPRPHTPKASHASGPTPLSEMTENAGASSSSSKQNEDASDFREHIEFVDDHLLVGPSTTFSLNVPNDNMSQSSMAPNVDGSYVFGPGNENLIAMPPNPYAPYCDVFDSDAHYRWTPQVVQYSPSPYGFWE